MKTTGIVIALILATIGLQAPTMAQEIDRLEEIEPFTLDGRIDASISTYHANGIEGRRPDLGYTVSASLTPTIYGVAFPLTILVSEQENSIRQPFNEFGIAPTYGNVKGYLGYGSIRFGDYSLADSRFLGAGIEGTMGKLRFAGMIGRMQRAVDEDTLNPNVLPAYERTGYGMMLGVGGDQGYCDLSFMNASDDSSSLVRRPVASLVTPAANSVLGLKGRIAIVDGVGIDFEGAASLYTRDLGSAQTADSNDIPEFLTGIQPIRSSTTLAAASKATLNAVIGDVRAQVGYERIEPEYTSLGASPFPGDRETYTVGAGFDLAERSIRIDGRIGFENDNILGTKQETTKRVVGSFNGGYQASDAFAIDAQYSNFASRGAGRPDIPLDSLSRRTVTQSAAFVPRLLLTDSVANHSTMLVLSWSGFADESVATGKGQRGANVSGTLGYTMSLVHTPASIGGTLLYSITTVEGLRSTNVGGTLNGSTTIAAGALSLDGSVGAIRSASDFSEGTTVTESLTLRWKPSHAVGTISAGVAATQTDVGTAFDELTMRIGYSYDFMIGGHSTP